MASEEQTGIPQQQSIDWRAFLESLAPSKQVSIRNLAKKAVGSAPMVNTEDIELFCESEGCNGTRNFQYTSGAETLFTTGSLRSMFLQFQCRNCQQTTKLFAILAALDKGQTARATYSGRAVKLGERPPFGPHTPARVLRLIQDDRDLFLIGRRAESQGMGIGAFAYYRRVVENEKAKLFQRIIDVAKELGIPEDQLRQLEEDRDTWQFSQSVEGLKGVVPRELLIKGHNPLQLLHRALSEGLHSRSDEECLKLATTIRLVIVEFAQRASEVMRQRDELDAAVNRLLNRDSSETASEESSGLS